MLDIQHGNTMIESCWRPHIKPRRTNEL